MKHLINTTKALTLLIALGTTSAMSMTIDERKLITEGTLPYINTVLSNTASCEDGAGVRSAKISRKLAKYYFGLCTKLLEIEDRAVLKEEIKGLGEQAYIYKDKLRETFLKVYEERALHGILAPYSEMMNMVADHFFTIEEGVNNDVATALPVDNSLFKNQYP